jgi:tol-pal system protein YbgF
MKIHVIVAIGLTAALLMPVSAVAQNREHQQMAAEVRMLQEQTQQLSQAIQQTLSRLNELSESAKLVSEALKKVDARLDAAETANRKAAADQKLGFDSLSTDVRIVREGTQNVNVRIGLLSEEVEALRTSLPSLVAPQAAATAEAGVDGQPTGPVPVPPVAAQARSGLSAGRLFQAAMADYASGDYRLAISGFQTLLNDWPTSEQADDAQYYIGYSYLQQKKYPEAIKAFSDVIANYPKGDKVPDAYVDLGTTQRALGQNEAARAAWDAVIQKFPSSSSAIIARTKLDGLPQPPAPPKP